MHDLSNNEKRSLVQRIAHSLPPAEKAEQSGVSDEKREQTKTTLSIMTMQCR
jgi:hypothetical protein